MRACGHCAGAGVGDEGPADASCLPEAQLPVSQLPGLWGQGRPCRYMDGSGMGFYDFILDNFTLAETLHR